MSNCPIGLTKSWRQDHYEQLRYAPYKSELRAAPIQFDSLMAKTHRVNDGRYDIMESLFDRKKIRGLRITTYVHRLNVGQEAWLDLAKDYAIYGTQQHDGNLEEMPFMQPKPITSSEMVYPLRAKKPPYFVP